MPLEKRRSCSWLGGPGSLPGGGAADSGVGDGWESVRLRGERALWVEGTAGAKAGQGRLISVFPATEVPGVSGCLPRPVLTSPFNWPQKKVIIKIAKAKHQLGARFIFIYLFLEGKGEREREGEKHQCVIASRTPPTGDLGHYPGMCPD